MKKVLFTLFLLAGFTLISWCHHETVNTDDNINENEIITQDDSIWEEEFVSTMEEIYKKGGKMTCTMTLTEEGMTMNGTLYIDWKKMRSDLKGSAQWMNLEISNITRDGYSYTRNSKENEGWKEAYNDDDIEDDNMDDSTEYENTTKFVCKKGVSDNNIFDIPENVIFSELPTYDF